MKNEHDFTKLMIEALRANSKSNQKLIRENEDIDSEGFNENNLDNVEKEYFKKNKESFLQKVSNGSTFDEFAIDKDTRNVVFGGKFRNGIEWSYSYTNGIQLGTPSAERFVSVKREDIKELEMLVNYYSVWQKEWDTNFNEDAMLKNKE